MAFSDWSTTASLNNYVGGIYIGENMARADVNNAFRAVMAEAKDGVTNPDSFTIDNSTLVRAVTPGDPNSAILFRSVTPGRRGEIQVSPNDGTGGLTKDLFAGGEFTAYGYDVDGPLGSANNIALTIRAARNGTTGAVTSWDIATFAPGTTADVPFRILNEAKGYVFEISATTGKGNFIQGLRVGDAIGGFTPVNPTSLLSLASDAPAMTWELKNSAGTVLNGEWRARVTGAGSGDWSLYNVTAGLVPFAVTSAGAVKAPYVSTAITSGGNNTPNARIDPATGELIRTGWSKVTAAADATDLATAITLVNQIKSTLISYGIMQ